MATEVHIALVFLNHCVTRLNAGEVDTALASMAKWWTTELQTKIVDRGVQLFGGYGYMTEYPIAKAFVDSHIQTIYGGTTRSRRRSSAGRSASEPRRASIMASAASGHRESRLRTVVQTSSAPITFGEAPVSMSSTELPSRPRQLGETPMPAVPTF